MATIKRIYGDYQIVNKGTNLASGSNVTISTDTLFIDGNLLVGGNSTSVSKTDLNVTDNIIVLNVGETGTGITLGTAGLFIDRGLATNVGIRYNESVTSWEATNDGSTWKYLLQSTTPGTGLTQVEDDPLPKLGGNLNITGHTIYDTSANVTVFAGTPAAGGSGVFVNANGSNNQELLTKVQALIYTVLL